MREPDTTSLRSCVGERLLQNLFRRIIFSGKLSTPKTNVPFLVVELVSGAHRLEIRRLFEEGQARETDPEDSRKNAQKSQNEDSLFIAGTNSAQAIHALRSRCRLKNDSGSPSHWTTTSKATRGSPPLGSGWTRQQQLPLPHTGVPILRAGCFSCKLWVFDWRNPNRSDLWSEIYDFRIL